MIKVLLWCMSCMLLWCQPLAAQPGVARHLSFSAGMHNHRVLDQTISPMIYRGNGLPLQLEFVSLGSRYRHQVSAAYSNMSLASHITNADRNNIHRMENIYLQLHYAFLKNIFHADKASHFAGPQIITSLNYRDLTMHLGAEGMTTTADHASSLCFSYHYQYRDFPVFFDQLSVSFSTALLSYVILEGTYHADFNEAIVVSGGGSSSLGDILRNGRFVTLNKYQQLNAGIGLNKSLGPRFSASAFYQLHYYSFNKYERLLKARSLNNTFLLGIHYHLTRHEN